MIWEIAEFQRPAIWIPRNLPASRCRNEASTPKAIAETRIARGNSE